jgi:predicted GNAT family acetyltransferase
MDRALRATNEDGRIDKASRHDNRVDDVVEKDTLMTDPNQTTAKAQEEDGTGADLESPLDEDQKVLMDEVAGDRDHRLDLMIVNDGKVGVYAATAGGQQVGGLTYNDAGGRVVLVAVSILPQFRNQGAATKLIRHVLDDLRTQGKKATVLCPIVRTFIDKHAEYQDVVDREHPGVVKVGPR